MADTSASAASKPLTATQRLPIEIEGRAKAEARADALQAQLDQQTPYLEAVMKAGVPAAVHLRRYEQLMEANTMTTPTPASSGTTQTISFRRRWGAPLLVLAALIVIGVVIWFFYQGKPTNPSPKPVDISSSSSAEVSSGLSSAPPSSEEPAQSDLSKLIGATDSSENRDTEMVAVKCPDSLRTTAATPDGYTVWDTMTGDSSFYSYDLALKHYCSVTGSVLSGDRTPDPSPDGCPSGSHPFIDTETNETVCVINN